VVGTNIIIIIIRWRRGQARLGARGAWGEARGGWDPRFQAGACRSWPHPQRPLPLAWPVLATTLLLFTMFGIGVLLWHANFPGTAELTLLEHLNSGIDHWFSFSLNFIEKTQISGTVKNEFITSKKKAPKITNSSTFSWVPTSWPAQPYYSKPAVNRQPGFRRGDSSSLLPHSCLQGIILKCHFWKNEKFRKILKILKILRFAQISRPLPWSLLSSKWIAE